MYVCMYVCMCVGWREDNIQMDLMQWAGEGQGVVVGMLLLMNLQYFLVFINAFIHDKIGHDGFGK